jgi:DNA repair exonuclease SbcCD ATPase subunit
MLKQDPSLLNPAEVVHALRHHLQALENALQQISQNAERQITALRQAEAALSNLDGQLVRISNSLLQADPSKPDDLTSRLEDALSILEQQALSSIAGESLSLAGELHNLVRERSELERLRGESIDELLKNKQFGKAFPGFALGSGIVSFAFFMLLIMLGASANAAFNWIFWINVLGYLGFLLRGTLILN